MPFSTLSKRVTKFLRSTLFFRLTLLWFAINTGWIALSAAYPMAFDEQYHFGLIQLYTQKFTPFWSALPDNGSMFGALTRDPSYMLHYLMSFPLRLIDLFVSSEMSRVLILRFLCLFMFGTGVVLFRKLLRRIGLSKATANVSMFFFVSLPIVPLLASQINYDNLLFLLTPLCLLLLLNVIENVRSHEGLKTRELLLLGSSMMFTLLVKFSFLPIALMMFVILLYYVFRYNLLAWRKIPHDLWRQFKAIQPKIAYSLLVIFIILFGLCIERYGINIIRYKNPAPDCAKVLSVEDCMAFSPWRRNFNTRNSLVAGRLPNPDPSLSNYITRMWYPTSTNHLFFALDGPRSGYIYGDPFTLLEYSAVGVTIMGLSLFAGAYPWMRKRYLFGVLFLIASGYVLSLLQRNFSEYQYLGYPFGIQGRYLVLFVPLIIGAAIAGFVEVIGKATHFKPWLATSMMLLVITQGGGATTYIMRSNSDWYWQRPAILKANDNVRRIIDPWNVGR